MSARWREWKRHGAPRMLVQWLRNGVPLRWRGPAPPASGVADERQDEEKTKELRALLQSGAFERGEAHVVAPTFLIPKKDGTKRLIHDLRITNKYIAPPRFTLHGARDAGDVTRNSSWLAVLDLKHGYQQVAMEPQARKYLGARLGGETLVSTVLPFGLNLSPYVFTRLTGWLAREIRSRFHLEVAVYIDDFLLGAASKVELEDGIRKVKAFFEELGVVVSSKKEVCPARKVEFIGFTWDAARKVVGVPRARRAEYRRAVHNLLRHAQSKATWRRLVGKLVFLREAVGPTMRHVRSLIRVVTGRRNGRGLLEAQGEARDDLQWWFDKLGESTELSLALVPVTGSITTDASDGRVGYLINMGSAGQVHFEGSRSVRDQGAHINRKELEAVLRAMQERREELRGRHLVWYTDSVTACAAVRRQGTQRLSEAAWGVTKDILDLAQQEGIRLSARHVPGRLNAAADALSRLGEARTAWEQALARVAREWGPWEEDPCGATGEATSLLEGLEWARRRALLLPKAWEVGKVVRHLALCAASEAPQGDPTTWDSMAVLVTPLWRGATWWPVVERMRVAYLHLGRQESEDMRAWRQRNGHWPDWTASLIPLGTRCGRTGQGPSTRESFSDSFSGKRREGWLRGEAQREA